MKLCISPYCGVLVDLDSVPSQHPTNGTKGKFCPVTHLPLDHEAIENTYIDASGDVVNAAKAGWTEKVDAMYRFEFAGIEPDSDTDGTSD